jgi:protein-L-isoaspartate O-methyltransferase
MIRTNEDFRRLLAELGNAAWALAAISAGYEAGLVQHLGQPRRVAELSVLTHLPENVVDGLVDVLVAVGCASRDGDLILASPGFAPFAGPPLEETVRAEVEADLRQACALMSASPLALSGGWQHTDSHVRRSVGQSSGVLATTLVARLVPELPGLKERLSAPGAAFLDVGTGVAGLAIQMCALYPQLHVVGVDPHTEAVAEARQNILTAGLERRVEVRQQAVETLSDAGAFDLAWLPQPFLSAGAFDGGLDAVTRALRPGGYLLVPVLATAGQSLRASLARLRTALWGGTIVYPAAVEAALRDRGFDEVRAVPAPLCPVVVGRRR